MKLQHIAATIISLSMLSACKSDFKSLDKASSGDADFSKYVAIGNSLTAGYADNSLTREGQIASYPNMLAQQFKYAGGGDFVQPLLPGNYGWPSGKLVLSYVQDCTGATSLGPSLTRAAADTSGSGNNIGNDNYNNLGIPGIKLAHIALNGYGALNPYANRIFRNPNTQSPMEVFLNSSPTFFTLWLGSNDVLGYATSGGSGTVGGFQQNDITDPALFAILYDSLVSNLTKNGAKGVLINIPNITSIPFFNTIPTQTSLTSAQASALTTAYHSMGMTHINFQEGINSFVIQDDALGARQMNPGELLLLTTPGDSLKCGGWGTTRPIPKQYVLDADEIENINVATEAFNNTIANTAERYNLALMNAYSFLQTLSSGFTWDAVTYTPAFVTGGAFSLDGVHLTPRGYGLVTNQLITVINQYYNATLPYHNINAYPGIKFPQ